MTVEQHLAVNAKVEEFRERLGLKPFALFAKEQHDRHKITMPPELVRVPRQTGRSTYALIVGLARAIETGEPLYVMGATDLQTNHLIDRAKMLMAQLNINVPIKKIARGVVVRDHMADEIAELTNPD